jgi:hypothetical protein
MKTKTNSFCAELIYLATEPSLLAWRLSKTLKTILSRFFPKKLASGWVKEMKTGNLCKSGTSWKIKKIYELF